MAQGKQFRPEEIVVLRHLNQKTGVWTESEFPKVGGRLRLSHEANGNMDISTEVIQYDGSVAVVRAVTTIEKGSFSGFGMASTERDKKLAPAILELAETRAIARSLRWAGFGVEFCSAEEMSNLEHLEEETPPLPPEESFHQPQSRQSYSSSQSTHRQPETGPRNGNGQGASGRNGDSGNGNTGRISQKQHAFLLSLAEDRNVGRRELDEMSKERFGVVVNFLSKSDASSFIAEMTSN